MHSAAFSALKAVAQWESDKCELHKNHGNQAECQSVTHLSSLRHKIGVLMCCQASTQIIDRQATTVLHTYFHMNLDVDASPAKVGMSMKSNTKVFSLMSKPTIVSYINHCKRSHSRSNTKINLRMFSHFITLNKAPRQLHLDSKMNTMRHVAVYTNRYQKTA
eukprot:5518810-Amphidinium_carterae.1